MTETVDFGDRVKSNRVMLNDAPLNVDCDQCPRKAGQVCDVNDDAPPGWPVRWHQGRVRRAEEAGFANSVDASEARGELIDDLVDRTSEAVEGEGIPVNRGLARRVLRKLFGGKL